MKRRPVGIILTQDNWPDERVEKLRALVAAKVPAEDIARQLGVTLSALRNKAHRLSLSLRSPPAARPVTVCPNVVPLVREALARSPEIMAMRPDLATEEQWAIHLSAYVANVELDVPANAVGRLLKRSGRLVRYAVPRIEDRRDDPRLDRFLDDVGEQARELAA